MRNIMFIIDEMTQQITLGEKIKYVAQNKNCVSIYSKHMEKFEVFCKVVSSSINLLFLKISSEVYLKM